MNRTGHSAVGLPAVVGSSGRLLRAIRQLEHEVLVGVDRAADMLLSPLAVDFRGWSFGDQRNETWM